MFVFLYSKLTPRARWRLEIGEITLKVGIEKVISVIIVGNFKLFFNEKYYLLLDNIYVVLKIKRNFIFVSFLFEQPYSISFSLNKAFSLKNDIGICSANKKIIYTC